MGGLYMYLYLFNYRLIKQGHAISFLLLQKKFPVSVLGYMQECSGLWYTCNLKILHAHGTN